MADASEVSVSNIFNEKIKTAIKNVRKVSNRRPDVKQSIIMFQKHFASSLNENDSVSYIT